MRRAAAVTLLVATLAGCGGGSRHPTSAPKPPRLPRALAQTWAAQANAVAQALAGGDCKTAHDQANQLRDAVNQAVSQHEVPARLASILTPTVVALPDRIGDCHPTPPAKPPKHDHGKHKGQGDQG